MCFRKNPFCQKQCDRHPAIMHIFDRKNSNSVKTELYYGSKKSIECPFFPIFLGKIASLMSIFYQENTILEKTHCSQVHILSKNVQSLKNTVVRCYFFKIFRKKFLLSSSYLVKKTSILSKLNYIMGLRSQYEPPTLIPIFGQKASILSNYTILWGKTVNKMPFFSIFMKKYCSHAHIL